MFDDEACHGTPTGLCPDGLHLQVVTLPDIEQRLDDSYLAAHTLPVEQMLILFSCQMNENAVVGFDSIDKQVGQTALPKAEHVLPCSTRQLHMALHSVWQYAIQRTKHAIEERGDPQMLLRIVKVAGCERFSLQMLVSLAMIGKNGRQLRRALEESHET